MHNMYDTDAYSLIKSHYSSRTNTAGVPLINHINEGLVILGALGSCFYTQAAFCVHPLLQDRKDLVKYRSVVADYCSSNTIIFAMEYCHSANSFLPHDRHVERLYISPLEEVNQMLIADKVQNRKEFIMHKVDVLPDFEINRLIKYFKVWFNVLDINPENYADLCYDIDRAREEHAKELGRLFVEFHEHAYKLYPNLSS